MNISGPQSVEKTVQAAAYAIKKSIDNTDISNDDKDKAKQAIDDTTFVVSEVPNTFVYWLAVGAVALVALIIVVGTFFLVGSEKATPPFLEMTLATAIGALAGMVVPTPKAGL